MVKLQLDLVEVVTVDSLFGRENSGDGPAGVSEIVQVVQLWDVVSFGVIINSAELACRQPVIDKLGHLIAVSDGLNYRRRPADRIAGRKHAWNIQLESFADLETGAPVEG